MGQGADTVRLAGHPPRDLATVLQGAKRCPVVHTGEGDVVITGHPEVVAAAGDPVVFSSRVSSHLQLPNGLDGEEHARWRALIERYLERGVVDKRGPEFREAARTVIAESLPGPRGEVDAVTDLGTRYAVRAMTTCLGWPRALEGRLVAWVGDNAAATRSGDPARTAAVAADFDRIITAVVEPLLTDDTTDEGDVTRQLITDTTLGRPLHREEIVSVLRNWTGGDLSSMALCIGVILHRLSTDTALQEHLRYGVPQAEFEEIIDEILRLDSPFVSNRRVTTRPVTIGGVHMPEGQRVRLHWTAANLDPAAFEEPGEFRPDTHAAVNLVWGTGPHVCPGRALSMTELRAFLGELLAAAVVRPGSGPGTRSTHPVGGWESLPLHLERC